MNITDELSQVMERYRLAWAEISVPMAVAMVSVMLARYITELRTLKGGI